MRKIQRKVYAASTASELLKKPQKSVLIHRLIGWSGVLRPSQEYYTYIGTLPTTDEVAISVRSGQCSGREFFSMSRLP